MYPEKIPALSWSSFRGAGHIIKHAIHDFINGDRLLLSAVRLPDNGKAEENEFCVDHLDRMALLAWETDVEEIPRPVPEEKKAAPYRFGRTATAKIEKRRQEAARRAKSERKRDRRFTSPQRLAGIRKRRIEWAEVFRG